MARREGRGKSKSTRAGARRWARKAKRRTNGTFIGFERPTLYEIVKDGTEIAARLWPQDYKRPEAVSVRAFNRGRRHLDAKYGRRVPQGHAIRKALRAYDGTLWHWPDLVSAVHDPKRDINAVDRERLTRPDAPATERAIEYSLLRVAYLRKTQTLRPHEYVDGYDALTHYGGKHTLTRRAWFDKLLASEGKILVQKREWGTALTTAGLLVPPEATAQAPDEVPPLPRDLAIALFYATNGWLPLRCELEGFAHRSFALAGDEDLPWMDWIDRAIRTIKKLKLPLPPPFGIRTPPADWKPIDLDLGPLPPPRDQPRTMREILEWLRTFRSETTARTRPRQKAWQAFARSHEGAPSWGTIARRGGIDKLIRIAARDDWETYANRIDAQKAKPAKPSPRREARPALTRELARIADSEKAQAIVQQLERSGVMTARELAEKLKMPGRTVRYFLQALVAARRVEPARRIYNGKTIMAYVLGG